MWKGMERTDLQSPGCQNVQVGPQRPESTYLLYAMSVTTWQLPPALCQCQGVPTQVPVLIKHQG